LVLWGLCLGPDDTRPGAAVTLRALEALLTAAVAHDSPKQVTVWTGGAGGAIVDGEALTLAEYSRRFPGGPRAAAYRWRPGQDTPEVGSRDPA
jgi:hypothetical protein